MDFKNVTTLRGGKYTIHKYGNLEVTRTIFGDSWLIITDPFILADISKLISDYKSNPQNSSKLLLDFTDKYIGKSWNSI